MSIMGHFAGLGAGVSVFVAAAAGAAPGPATGAFPPTQPPAASASASSTALPPPPPRPPAAPPGPAAPSAPAPATEPAPPPPAAPAAPSPAYLPPGYGYYYPPPYYLLPPPRVKERFPDNAAVSSSPFVDMIVASVSWQNRVSQFFNVGVQGGTYVAGRVRLTANIILPTSGLTDDYEPAYKSSGTGGGYYVRQESKAASLFYGASLGIVALSSPTFVMSPGLAFSRTDVSDYGSSLAVSLPFEWVTGNGLRLGLEFDAGRAFGGSNHLQCFDNLGTGGACSLSPPVTEDRPTGTSVVLQFELGFGFNHPDPLPPLPAPSGAPYALPAAQPVQPAPSVAPAPAPG